MFSYFLKGIKNTHPERNIDFTDLIKLIQNNPHQSHIEKIRELRSKGDAYYKVLKELLPYLTPNCTVRVRNLEEQYYDLNFKSFSQFIYIDIDYDGDVYEYKKYIIEKYSHLISMVCISSSAGGVSILFKVTNVITKDNFEQVRNTIINTIIPNEIVDENAGGIGRAMFISYDPDVYYRYENSITLDLDGNNECIGIDPNSYPSYNRVKPQLLNKKNKENSTSITIPKYYIYNIEEVLANIITRTIVPVDNPIVDFKEYECIEPYIPAVITDTNKHRTYFKLIHQWSALNPEVNMNYLFSYLFFCNNTRAKPRMGMNELVRFFTSVYETIQSTGKVHAEPRIKRVHFNPDNEISQKGRWKERESIAKYLNGLYRRSITINKIQAAKLELEQKGLKVTNRAIARITELDEGTIRLRIMDNPIDMDDEVSLIN